MLSDQSIQWNIYVNSFQIFQVPKQIIYKEITNSFVICLWKNSLHVKELLNDKLFFVNMY